MDQIEARAIITAILWHSEQLTPRRGMHAPVSEALAALHIFDSMYPSPHMIEVRLTALRDACTALPLSAGGARPTERHLSRIQQYGLLLTRYNHQDELISV